LCAHVFQSAMSTFVCIVLGMKSVAPKPFSLKSLQEVPIRTDVPGSDVKLKIVYNNTSKRTGCNLCPPPCATPSWT
jgi:hypothetical protein